MKDIEKRNKWVIDRLKQDFPKPDYKIHTKRFDLGYAYAVMVEFVNSTNKVKRHAVKIERIVDGKPVGINYSSDKGLTYKTMVESIKQVLHVD